MANCVCYQCKRPMDCTGEDLCDLCEYDREQLMASTELVDFGWLSECCDATHILELFESPFGATGYCQRCGDTASFHLVRIN